MGGGGGGTFGSVAPAPTQATAGGNKGGSSGTATAQSTQDLVDELRRQRVADTVKQGFQQAGAAVGQQQPYMQGRPGVAGAAYQSPGAQPNPAAAALGPLFQQPGISSGGGIDEQQLAAILRQLGYG